MTLWLLRIVVTLDVTVIVLLVAIALWALAESEKA